MNDGKLFKGQDLSSYASITTFSPFLDLGLTKNQNTVGWPPDFQFSICLLGTNLDHMFCSMMRKEGKKGILQL
jgi:hypothetical protein